MSDFLYYIFAKQQGGPFILGILMVAVVIPW